ncbi:MAG: CoB--CoM heterodisulfide reductase subunit C [Methanobrevibacter sp.]|uniref:CoB--CoM heterodisulfide reductase subunit C n=1 Tax=Methanobrevibacter sp. TaxID=66852 RepID=UPI0025DC8244|nr:CoB--CoM heterodisulfide reductase subunit C [Methanobrevibacter sp.]MBE6509146.1 CoB--CoM heterodisulfide reductase subunit C [Methanobrevibacter sp.]
MSIINRLKSLFTGDNEKEVKDINADVSNTSNDVEVTSSQIVNDDVVSGTKTTVSREEPVKEEPKDDITDIETLADGVDEELHKIEDIPLDEAIEKVDESIGKPLDEQVEKLHEIKEKVVEAVEIIEEDVKEKIDENNKERDNMTLLTDTELLTDCNRDPDFTAEFIDSGIETVKHCFQCGTCSGSCPSGRRTPYKVRQIVRKCLLGLKEEVITDDALWMCTTCYTCQERCLRSVKIVEIIKKARNIAAHAGYMAKPHKMTGVFVMNTGHGVPINDATKALRVKIGLPEIPPTTHAYPEALEEVQKICKITGFDELIGYDEATGGLKE